MSDSQGSGTLHLQQRIAAPREAVFDFLVDPAKMARWFGTANDIDPVPGGRFCVNTTGDDIATGTYLEVDPPRRLVFTWGWEGSADVPPGSTTVTITLSSDGEHTIVDLAHAGLPGGPDDPHQRGWTYFLGRLERVATGVQVGPVVTP